jgi:Ca2+-binding RTX toxin-like protein
MTPFKRVALIAALIAIAVLTASTTASADVTPVVDGRVLTVTGGDGADTIALGAAGGFITVNGNPIRLASDGNGEIIVNANGGNDEVDASALAQADYGSLTINGGDGDDALTGGAGGDQLAGDGGNDRLVGFEGGDDVSGGDGNDVIVWNNRDFTDFVSGDGGVDEVEVNGSPTGDDAFVAGPSSVAGMVQLRRTNLVQFTILFSAERLTINGLGGGDSFTPDPAAPSASALAALTSLTLNGGSDDDKLVGGDGNDIINGGDGNDSLQGGGGDDRLTGDRGADNVFGDAGDDALVWNNGDGSDSNVGGGGFDRVEVNGSAAAGDAFTLAPSASGATFQRTNLVPFTIDLGDGSTEAVAVAGGGGDDRFTVSPGLPGLLVAADGGAGNDILTGGDGNETLLGGAGNDVLTPGGGSDVADGGDGDDQLFTRDGVGDLVRGGAGTDSAQTDAPTVDAISDIEALDATAVATTPPGVPPGVPPAPDTIALLPTLGKVAVTRRHGQLLARIPISCPAGESGGCRTTLTLQTAKAIRLGRVRAVLVLGSKAVRLGQGQRSTVSIRLAGSIAALAKRGKISARVQITSSDAAGNATTRSLRLSLRIPRAEAKA